MRRFSASHATIRFSLWYTFLMAHDECFFNARFRSWSLATSCGVTIARGGIIYWCDIFWYRYQHHFLRLVRFPEDLRARLFDRRLVRLLIRLRVREPHRFLILEDPPSNEPIIMLGSVPYTVLSISSVRFWTST